MRGAYHLGVTADQLLLTNGLDEGILAAAIAGLRGSPSDAPHEAIVVVPAFDMYAACADALGGRVIEITLREHFQFPIDERLAAIGPRTRVFPDQPEQPDRAADPERARSRSPRPRRRR